MTSDLASFQEFIIAEMKKAFSQTVVDHAMNPRNVGNMESADGYASITSPCGDTMDIWLKVKDNTIVDSTFMTDGCSTTIAVGSMTTELAKGKTITQALKIDQQYILNALEGLPKESQHCALLAANTLRAAIMDYLTIKKEPWKRTYRQH